MSAQKVLLRSGNYREKSRYANSDFGNVEQLLQDLQSQVLVEKEKRRIAEHRADDLEKQLKDLQELTRYELSMEVDRRRDAERRNHDLELQLMRAEAEGRRISAADEQLSREQLLLRKGHSTLLPVDRTTSVGGRNFTGMDRVEKGDKVSLRRFASLSHPNIRNDNISSSSSYNNSHRDDDNEDEEWQFTVRHNERILKNSKRKSTKLTRNRFPEKQHNLQKSTSSVSTERRNVVTHFAAHHNEIQGTRPTAEHVSWRSGSVRERTQSAGQMSSGQLVAGVTHMTEHVSRREGNGNTRGAEHASKGGADAWGVEQTSTKVMTSNWSASEKSEDELRRAASLVDVSKDRMKEGKRSLRKKVMEAENEDIPKEVHQDSVMTTISHKDSTDVTNVLHSSSPSSSHSMKTDIYADPAFKTHHQRTVFWQQVASSIVQQQQTESSRDPSFPGDRTLLSEETASPTTAKLSSQGIMKLKAKCESTPNFSEV